MLIEHLVALARADKNFKKNIPWISILAVGMFEGCLADIQRIGPMFEVDIFWTSTGLTCVMWVSAGFLTSPLIPVVASRSSDSGFLVKKHPRSHTESLLNRYYKNVNYIFIPDSTVPSFSRLFSQELGQFVLF